MPTDPLTVAALIVIAAALVAGIAILWLYLDDRRHMRVQNKYLQAAMTQRKKGEMK